jgi:hypothetical protein
MKLFLKSVAALANFLPVVALLMLFTLSGQAQSWLTDGLIAYYPFNGNANDESGNGNDGTVQGATLTADRFNTPNSAYYFDGASYIYCNNFSSITGNHPFTVSFWCKPTGPGGWMVCFGQPSDGNAFECGNHSFSQATFFGSIWKFGHDALDPETTISANTFNHLVITYDGTKCVTYRNGVQTSVQVINFVRTKLLAGSLQIGKQISYDEFFVGVLDDVRIYNRALSANEVAQLYAMESTPPSQDEFVTTMPLLRLNSAGKSGVRTVQKETAPMATTPTVQKDSLDSISDLFPTGVDDTGSLLPIGYADQHYRLNGAAAIAATPAGPWIHSPGARWLCLTANGNSSVPPMPPYNYMTKFVLPTNALPDSVSLTISLASDDGVTVFLNGVNTRLPQVQSEFAALNTFRIEGTTSPFFINGINKLTFQVNNAPTPNSGPSPSGLLVAAISGSFKLFPSIGTGTITGQSSLTDGLVAYYPFNGNANDESGNGHNGMVIGAALNYDHVGNANHAYNFNGTSDYIVVTGVPTISGLKAVTISAWVKWNSISGGWQDIVGKYMNDSAFHGEFLVQSKSGTTVRIAFQDSTGHRIIRDTAIRYIPGKWYHLVAIYDGSNGNGTSLYINGSIMPTSEWDGSVSGPLAKTRLNFYIGARTAEQLPTTTTEYFNGAIDTVRIYNRALSANEVAQLYAMESTPPSQDAVVTTMPPMSALIQTNRIATRKPAKGSIVTITNLDGRVYENIQIVGDVPDGIYYSITDTNKVGGGKILFDDLPKSWRDIFNYNPELASQSVKPEAAPAATTPTFQEPSSTIEELERGVEQSIDEAYEKLPAIVPVKVLSLKLSRTSANSFKGVAEVQSGQAVLNLDIDVVVDGDKFRWQKTVPSQWPYQPGTRMGSISNYSDAVTHQQAYSGAVSSIEGQYPSVHNISSFYESKVEDLGNDYWQVMLDADVTDASGNTARHHLSVNLHKERMDGDNVTTLHILKVSFQ